MKLREYQLDAVEKLREKIRSGARSLVLVSPTGSGKTVIASHIIDNASTRGVPVLFLAHRKELIDQASGKLTAFEVPHGVIMAGYPSDTTAPVQVASVQTAIRRKMPAHFRLIIVDEAHHAAAESYRKIIDLYPDAIVIGLTATPFRADGRGLGNTFTDWVRVASVSELIDWGFLVPAKYWAPSSVDLQGVKRSKGDFDEAELADRVNKPRLIGNIVEHYAKITPWQRAICFAVNCDHSRAIVDAFKASGIPAAHLDAETPRGERENILADLALGNIHVVSNCGILSEGYDNPAVSVCIQARPTMSLSLHLQQIGRVLRPHPDKQFAVVIDHAGNTLRHGMATEDHAVDLGKGVGQKKDPQEKIPTLRTCSRCFAILPSSATECPACGAQLGQAPKPVKVAAGSLRELPMPSCKYCGSEKTEKRPHPLHGTGIWCSSCGRHLRWIGKQVSPQEFLKKQLELCRMKGWKEGRAAMVFKARYGRWPSQEDRAA